MSHDPFFGTVRTFTYEIFLVGCLSVFRFGHSPSKRTSAHVNRSGAFFSVTACALTLLHIIFDATSCSKVWKTLASLCAVSAHYGQSISRKSPPHNPCLARFFYSRVLKMNLPVNSMQLALLFRGEVLFFSRVGCI